MRRPRRALLLALGAALLSPIAAAQQPDDLGERAARVLAQQHCQTALPEEQIGTGDANDPGTSGRRRRSAGPPGDRAPADRWRDASGAGLGAGFAQLLFWTFLAIAAIAMVAMIARAVADRVGPATATAAAVRSVTVPDLEPVAVPDHESLAAAGRFADAIHALLQRALLHLHERGAGLRASTTGREALRVATVLPAALPALRVLVQQVERSHFGGRSVERSDYDASKQAFDQWSAACAPPR